MGRKPWAFFLLFSKGIMKKLLFLFISLVMVMASCSDKKSSQKEITADDIPTFVKADTTIITKIAEEYLELLKVQDYENAFRKLYIIDKNSQPHPIPDDEKTRLLTQTKTFPVLNYKLVEQEFIDEYNVTLAYEIEFFEKDPSNPIPNTIRMVFNPQRINADWYLCIANKSYMTREHIMNMPDEEEDKQ